jgi:hypothetical protein
LAQPNEERFFLEGRRYFFRKEINKKSFRR